MDQGTKMQSDGASGTISKVLIASQYERCRNSFNLLLENIDDQAIAQKLFNEFGRLRVWAGNSGAHRTGRVSLDYRLREASHLREELIKLLGELNEDLEEALELIEGGEGDCCPDSPVDFLAEQVPLDDEEVELNELESLVSDITHIITCLYKFSIAIQNPAPKERLHKIELIDVSHFGYWDIKHIEEKFRPLDSQNDFTVAKYLSERLSKANTKRRQLLKYYQAHHKKIARYIDVPSSSRSNIERNEFARANKPTTEDGSARAPDGKAATITTTMKSQTTVSTIPIERNQAVKIEWDEDDRLSQTSYASSTNHAVRIRVPPPPNEKAAFEGEPFECPYCFNLIRVKSRKGWKKHVFEDLQPYVCTFRNCPMADELYDSQREWFDHEVQFHHREWYCDTCSQSFSQVVLFQQHINARHSELVIQGNFEIIISRCERAIVTDTICPLCGITFTLQTLEKHLGHHLQEVALFALPHADRGGNEDKSKDVECSSQNLSDLSSLESDSDSEQSEGNQQLISPAAIEGIRCICSYQHDDGFLISCGNCKELQHGVCMGIDKNNVPRVYKCAVCTPGAHHLDVEKAISIQESFHYSISQEASKTDIHIEPPPQTQAILSPADIWARSLEIAEKQLSDNNFPPLDLTNLTLQYTKENIEFIIKALSILQEEDKKQRWSHTGHGKEVIVMERLGKLLRVMENYSNIIDVAMQTNQQVAALVWTAIRGIVQVTILTVDHIEIMKGFEVIIATLLEKMSICEFYSSIYATALEQWSILGLILPELHAAVIVLSVKARIYFEARGVAKSSNTLKSFDLEFQPFIEEINAKERALREYADAATTARIRGFEGALQDITSKLHDISTKATDITEQIQENTEDTKMFELLKMLTPLEQLKRHQEVRLLRSENTGTWLLSLESFCEWRDGDTMEENNNVFCCYGIPGAGKTVLCSAVIDHLYLETHKYPDIGVAYLYADYKDQTDQALVNILGSLLLQFLTIVPETIRDEVIEKLDSIRHQGKNVETKDTMALLKIRLKQFKRAFICIDAVDELEPMTRGQLLNVLKELVTNTDTRLFLTGRGHVESEVQKCFQVTQGYTVNISASLQDIETFVRQQIIEDPGSDAMDEALVKDIVHAIVKRSHGMFLLPALHIQMILGMPISRRREALEMLPADLYGSFQGMITIIKQQPYPAYAELGIQVLKWVHFAYRPLKLVELQHALAVDKGDTELDASNIPPPRALLACCLGLVVVDEATSTVRFMHYTLEEYFHKNAGSEFPNGCSSIAETCLTYLNFGGLGQHCPDNECLRETMNRYAFLDYAALFWGNYAKQQHNDNLTNLIRNLVEHEYERPPCAIQALYKHWYPQCSTIQKFSGIHAISYFGLSEFMVHSLQLELKDESGRTPLSWAAGNGQEGVVRLLVERQVDVNVKDESGRTPLSWAAWNGHEGILRFLIDREDTDVHAKDHQDNVPLLLAAGNGHEAVVRLLIGRDDVNIDAYDEEGKTPLSMAAEKGHEAVVRLLIERGDVDIDSRDNRSVTPLIVAAKNGYEAIVRLLMERDGVDINAKDSDGNTPLLVAAEKGHDAVVLLLIERDVDLNAKNHDGNTPLLVAAEKGHEAVVRLLLERGVDINVEDSDGNTPLLVAAEKGHDAVVLLLIERDVDLNAKNHDGNTPLLVAAEKGHEAVVRLLIEMGVDVNAKNNHGNTPLLMAAANGHEAIMRILIEMGVDVNARNHHGNTPLILAAGKGHEAVVRLLIEIGVDVNAMDYNCNTPLLMAAWEGHEAVVRLLIERGDAFTNVRNISHLTPLIAAARKGHEAVVRLLIEIGVDVNAKSVDGNTPLLVAALEGHEAIVRLLIERGDVDLNAMNGYQNTPLFVAAEKGHEAVVRLLIERDDVHIQVQNAYRQTPLHTAAENGHEGIVQLLKDCRR